MMEGAKHWPSLNEGDSQTDLGSSRSDATTEEAIDCKSDKEEPYAGIVERKPNLGTGLGDINMDVTAEEAVDCKSDKEETYAGIVKRKPNLGTGLGDINMDVVKEGQDFCGGLEGDGEFQAISRSRL